MTLELNDVLLRGEEQTLSLLASEGQMTCIVGGTAERRTHWLYALMGFEQPVAGFISVDGEPLTGGCIAHLRRHLAFAPSSLETVGQIVAYEPPTLHDVLSLRCNRHLAEADIDGECRRTGATGQKALLLALAAMRKTAVLVVDSPSGESAHYLHQVAVHDGRTVITATDDARVIGRADNIVELDSETSI